MKRLTFPELLFVLYHDDWFWATEAPMRMFYHSNIANARELRNMMFPEYGQHLNSQYICNLFVRYAEKH